MRDWQTIDSAPRDGTHILVLNDDKCVYEAWWEQEQWAFPFASFHGCGCCGFTNSERPTHWMPLPEPPKLLPDESQVYGNDCPGGGGV